MRRPVLLCLLTFVAPLASPALPEEAPLGSADARVAVASVLDAFHAAAARADEKAYFDFFAPEAVFLGTDAAERWDRAAFQAFAHPHFAKGQGWTFRPRDRHVDLSARGDVAWFDELLDSESYGECRGTGVLERIGERWRVRQYHLTIPMPNDLAKEFVALIREAAAHRAAAQK